jgi:hypothetical protein
VSYALIGVSPPPPQPLKEFPALARVTVNEGDLGRDKPKGLKVKLRGSEGKKAPRPTDSKIDGFEDHWTIGHRLAISIVQGTGEYPEGDEGGGGVGDHWSADHWSQFIRLPYISSPTDSSNLQ